MKGVQVSTLWASFSQLSLAGSNFLVDPKSLLNWLNWLDKVRRACASMKPYDIVNPIEPMHARFTTTTINGQTPQNHRF